VHDGDAVEEDLGGREECEPGVLMIVVAKNLRVVVGSVDYAC
jgi:hypothetical protein